MSDQSHSQSSQGPPLTWDPSHQGTGTPGRTTPPSAGGGGGGGGGGLAAGGVLFAGVLMFVSGVLAVFQGIAAIAQDDVYARVGDYVYELNLTGWGWVLLIVGAVAAVTGWRLLKGPEGAQGAQGAVGAEGAEKFEWARVGGIVLASLSLILQFLFLPYAPVWAVVQIAIDVFVIWALATYRPARPPRTPPPPVTPRAGV
ncbi:hypothetical protein OG352_22560 [Streptomyces sp. NBC_01485]|uniref:DUF7144 family membrane protein n=1 Tax=Streptomyces sp. NBC_01485 TaxID=2903884 RepID=UPI002E339FBA|nr:hypothetical protein [Streptomyces sp. NBC_01485]